MPACGHKGVTFRNLCELKCNNQKFINFGKCKKKKQFVGDCSVCPKEGHGICGTDGHEYANECQCLCKGNCKKYSNGRCPVEKSCARCAGILEPVCGKSNKTYDNICYLQCSKDRFKKKGKCHVTMKD